MIFLKKLTTENIGALRGKNTFDLSAPLVAIQGNNASGKSTVLEAVSFALFGSARGGKNFEIVTWGESRGHITLEFTIDTVEYIMSVSIYSDKSDRQLLIEGKTLTGKDALEYLANILGGVSLFQQSTILSQNDQGILSLTPSDRRKHLLQIYDINFQKERNFINNLLSKIKEDIVSLKSKRELLESQEYKILDKQPFGNIKTEEELKIKEQELQAQKNLLHKKQAEENQKAEKFAEINKKKTDIIQKQKVYNETTEKINNLVASLTSFNTDALKESLVKFEEENTKQTTETAEALAKHNKEEIEKTSKQLNEETTVINSQLQSLSNLITTLGENPTCPTCTQSIPEEFKAGIIECRDTSVANLNHVTDRLFPLQETLRDIEALEERITHLTHDKERQTTQIQSQINETELKRKHTQETLSLLTTQIAEFQGVDFASELAGLEKELEGLAVGGNGVSGLVAVITQVESEISKYREIVSANKGVDEVNANELARESADSQQIKSITSEIATIIAKNEDAETALQILNKKLPTYIVEKFVELLERDINNVLVSLYPAKPPVIKFVMVKDAINIYYGDDADKDISRASGFEIQAIVLAYKIALSRIKNYNLLVIDEADSAASVENANAFYQALLNIEGIQTIAITHKPSIRDLFSSVPGSKTVEL